MGEGQGVISVHADRGDRRAGRAFHQGAALLRAGRADRGAGPHPERVRDYAGSVLDRLRFIRSAQALGLTLGEIKGVIAFREQGSPPCGHVLDLIEARATDLDRRIAELRRLHDDLRALAARGRGLSSEACSPDLVCHILNPAPGVAAQRRATRLFSR